MRIKLFTWIFAVSILFFACSMIVSFFVMSRSYNVRHQNEVKTEARFLAAAVESNGMEFIKKTDKDTGTRITWIAKDGTVLYDNTINAALINNAIECSDVKDALKYGTGEAEGQYSIRLASNGTVLRVSVEDNMLSRMVNEMAVPTIFILVMAIILSVLIASIMSRKIMKPINKMDLENPDERWIYDELKPFVSRINAQNRQIHKQMEQLKEEHRKQDELRREFTANVSHELKTPLTTISGYAEIIRNGIAKEEDVERFAGNIYDEAGRMMTLVGDILRLSQMDSGSPGVEKKSDVNLVDVCESVLQRLERVAESACVEMKMHVDEVNGPYVISALPQMLDEIVYNLCENAVKYNKPNGSVDLFVEKAGVNTILTVKDTGIGIPKEDQERIFERFYRVDKSHSKKVGGTGLGLSIVKHGVRYNNADVVLESEPGVGTEIKVIFRKISKNKW